MKKHKLLTACLMVLLIVEINGTCRRSDESSPPSAEPQVQCIVTGIQFGEGPAMFNGKLYFSDIQANKINRWDPINGLTVFRDNSGGANGLMFTSSGTLLVCEGTNKRVISIDTSGNVKVIADQYQGKPLNEPNDLWISPSGDVYFTDPVYGGTMTQSGQYVFCLSAATGQLTKVIDDLVQPNGIAGTKDGAALFVADYGASKIYKYSVSTDGTLSNKQLFVSVQADGIKVDYEGNLYAASDSIRKFDPLGNQILTIGITGTLTNLCLVEPAQKVMYATTHNAVYQITLP